MSESRAEIYKRNIEGAHLHRFLGLKIESIRDGEARVSMPVNGHTLNPAGSLHGGVIYLVADVSAFAAVGPVLEEDCFAVTIDIQTSVYRGTTTGPVIFHGKVTKLGRRIAFMNVEVSDGDGKLIAEARVTKAITRGVPEPFQVAGT